MTVKFQPLFDLPAYDWYEQPTETLRDELQEQIDELRGARAEYEAERHELETAMPADRDFMALQELPGKATQLLQDEYQLRDAIERWAPMFNRDREAELRAASMRHDEAVDQSHAEYKTIGFERLGGPNEVGVFTPDMVLRHPAVAAARTYLGNVQAATCNRDKNKQAMDAIRDQLDKLTRKVLG